MDGKTARTLLAASVCVALAACSTKAERIQSGLRKGAQYVANLDWDKAGVEARNVLQIDPKNADAFLIAAEVEDGKGAFRNAYANYAKVVELKPSSIDGRLGLAHVYLLSGDVDKAGPLIDGVLGAEPQNMRAQVLQVALTARRGRQPEALAAADRIVSAGVPLPVESSLALAGLYYNAKSIDGALSVLDQAIASHPHDLRLVQMAAEIAQSGRPDDARVARANAYYASATTWAPMDDALWKNWATMHIRRQEIDQAEAILRKAIDVDPDNSPRRVALLKFTGAFRDKQQAEKAFLAAIDAHPKDGDQRFALVEFYETQGRDDDAIRILQGLVDSGKDTPAGLVARGNLAGLLMAQGKVDQARATLAGLLKANPRDSVGLVLRGRIELADGDAQNAIIDLRSAAKDRPGSTEIAGLLASAHELAGEPQLAREVLADAVKFNGDDPRAHLMLAADMVRTHELQAALPEVDAAIKAAPRNEAARRMKIEVTLALGDTAGAESAAVATETEIPGSPLGHMLHGRVLEREKKIAPALAQFDEAARLAPNDAGPTIAAVALLTSQRRFSDAIQRIDALEHARPGTALAQQMRGEVAIAMGDLPRAQAAFQQVSDAPGASAEAYKNLAAVMVARKDLRGALAVLDKGEQAHPADTLLAAARAEWLGRAGRVDDAIAVYEQILRRSPGSDVVANNLAFVLLESKRDKPSLDRALQLTSRFAKSNSPSFVDTLGLAHYRLGHYDQAADVLGRAATLAPGDADVQLHYGMALYRKGDVRQGGDIVRKALAGKVPQADEDEAKALLSTS